MKRAIVMLLSACCLAACAADLFVFSADGVEVGSKPRELPAQGFNRASGSWSARAHGRGARRVRMVANRQDAETGDCLLQ